MFEYFDLHNWAGVSISISVGDMLVGHNSIMPGTEDVTVDVPGETGGGDGPGGGAGGCDGVPHVIGGWAQSWYVRALWQGWNRETN